MSNAQIPSRRRSPCCVASRRYFSPKTDIWVRRYVKLITAHVKHRQYADAHQYRVPKKQETSPCSPRPRSLSLSSSPWPPAQWLPPSNSAPSRRSRSRPRPPRATAPAGSWPGNLAFITICLHASERAPRVCRSRGPFTSVTWCQLAALALAFCFRSWPRFFLLTARGSVTELVTARLVACSQLLDQVGH